jgi:transposase
VPGRHRQCEFYLSENGAEVGDLFMSLIYIAQLCGANPFDYFTQLQRHPDEMKENPSPWMPWNYRNTLQHAGASINAG